MKIKIKTWFILLLIILIVSILISDYNEQGHERKGSKNNIDSEKLMNMSNCLDAVYLYSGRRFNSLRDFEKTYYYPYNQEYDISLANRATLVIKQMNGKYYICEVSLSQNIILKQEVYENLISPNDEINRFLLIILEGEKERIINLKKFNKLFDDGSKIAADYGMNKKLGDYQSMLTNKQLLFPIINPDFPSNENEADSYLRWFLNTEGIVGMEDGYGHKIKHGLNDKVLHLNCAGIDKYYRISN